MDKKRLEPHLRYWNENGISEIDANIRAFVTKVFHHHPRLNPAQIAPALENYIGEPVTLARLNSFTAVTKTSARLPLYFLPGLCSILDSDDILLFLARERIRKLVRFAELELTASKDERERKRLRDELLDYALSDGLRKKESKP